MLENSPPGPLFKLISLFNRLFEDSETTILVGGAKEPVYQPLNGYFSKNRIVFTHDYFSSALHEVAHWCVAGKERRKLEDYGYWYAPDGRTQDQQYAFEKLEVKPQALEWIFSQSAGVKFRVSADNLSSNLGPSKTFKQAIFEQVKTYCLEGLPIRAKIFCLALAEEFEQPDPLELKRYRIQDIDIQ